MTEAVKGYIGGGITSALGLLVFCFGFVRMRKYQLIRDVPQSKIRSMAIGLVEVSGNVVVKEHLTSPLSHTDCVYYRYTIEEYRERRTSEGKTESDIVKIADEEKRIPFFVRDDTGQVIVEPEKAEFSLSAKKVFLREAKQLGGFANEINALRQVSDAVRGFSQGEDAKTDMRTEGLVQIETKGSVWHNPRHGDRRYTEYYIEPNELLYVLGTAASRAEGTSELMIHKGENEPTFIISDKSEKGLLRRLLLETWVCFVLGGLFFVIGMYILFKTLNILS